jgi:hypothetical protein
MGEYWTIVIELEDLTEEEFQQILEHLSEKLGTKLENDPRAVTGYLRNRKAGSILIDTKSSHYVPEEVREYGIWKWCDDKNINYDVSFFIFESHRVTGAGFQSTKNDIELN